MGHIQRMLKISVITVTPSSFTAGGPGFARLVLRTVLEKHAGEIRSDPGFRQAVFRLVFEKATPVLLRAWAKRERAEGNLEIAYRFEPIADQRERGEWTPSE